MKKKNIVVDNYSKVVGLREQYPCMTLQQIGDKTNLSRERVRQILSKSNRPTIHFKQKYICNNCENIIKNHVSRFPLFCDSKCRDEYRLKHPTKVTVICEQCGKSSIRYLSRLLKPKSGYSFCNRHCHATWLYSKDLRIREGFEVGRNKAHKVD